MGAWSHPACETCEGFGELEPYSTEDEKPCPDCRGTGEDTSKPKEWCEDKIAAAVAIARGFDDPPQTPILFAKKEAPNDQD